ncbi:hypothetical protein [Duganella sp. Root336D2]|uniref:hypothetical protein n=1 Tax=Duganella sp. Root336D2 TaxID=1736518 RepID=UPI000AEC304D|nr:hypothetical protein [Duganella sp. Root336D2]
MSKFKQWSKIVHSILAKQCPSIKRGQVQEILSAAFGHNTYASLRSNDLATLAGGAKYILVAHDQAVIRARELGISILRAEWDAAFLRLKPSGVSGDRWLISECEMHRAAHVAFEDSAHEDLYRIAGMVGAKDGHWCGVTFDTSNVGLLPDQLTFNVKGEVHAFNDEGCYFAIPVRADVAFPRVGRRFYGQGAVLAVAQSGSPKEFEPEFEPDFYGMSED